MSKSERQGATWIFNLIAPDFRLPAKTSNGGRNELRPYACIM